MGRRGKGGSVLRGRGLADHPSGSCGIGLRVEQETLIEMCPPRSCGFLWEIKEDGNYAHNMIY